MAIRKLLSFGIKAGLVSGTVFYTVDQGLWRDGEAAVQVYDKLYKAAAPYIKEVSSEVPVPPLPKTEDIGYAARYYWNCGIKKTFAFIRDLPDTLSDLSQRGYSAAYEKIQELNSGTETKTEEPK